jgi:WXG100 family type VII secretion target
MPGETIRIDFDQMNAIQVQWGNEADAVHAVIEDVQRRMGQLQSGDWYGSAASKFYAEMDGVVLPALQSLEGALREAQEATASIVKQMQEAESEVSDLLDGSDVEVPGQPVPLD